MYNAIFHIIFLLLYLKPFSQEQDTAQKILLSRTSVFETDGLAKSAGIKLRMNIPKIWISEDNNHPHIVKRFKNDTETVVCLLTMKKLSYPGQISKEDEQNLYNLNLFQSVAKSLGKNEKIRSTKIDGLNAGEIIFENVSENPTGSYFIKGISYVFGYNQVLILVTYNIITKNKDSTGYVFQEYINTFRNLASTITILNQWQ
jgi:hypothetical protein